VIGKITQGQNLNRIQRTIPKAYLLAAAALLLLTGFSIVLSLLIVDETARMVISDITSPLINLMATLFLFAAARQTRRISHREAAGWLLLALAQLMVTLGDTVWAILELGFQITPYPSVADLVYLWFYPLFLAGIILFYARRISLIEWFKRALDTGIVMTAAILGYWVILIGPLMSDSGSATWVEQFLALAYPTGDLVLLFGLLVIIYYRSDKDNSLPIFFVALSSATMIVIDSFFSYQTWIGVYISGGFLDIGYLIVYVLIGLAGLLQTYHANTNLDEPDSLELPSGLPKVITVVSSLMPYLWVVGAYFLFFEFHHAELQISFNSLFTGVGIIITLVILRQMLALRENSALLVSLNSALAELKRNAFELSRSNQNLRQEIDERARVEAQLAHDALHDGLTGLANRVLLLGRLGHAIEHHRRDPGFGYSILFLDLDNFKTINDELGHSTGDRVLIEVARRLLNSTRSVDTVARFGGDEFVILLENTADKIIPTTISRRILADLSLPLAVKDREVHTTCSIGIVQGIAGYTNPEDILRDVDIAMYRAKEKGKARAEIFTLKMRTSALTLIEMERELRRALANQEFTLYYQPIYDLTKKRIVGLEALVRWNHPLRGLLLPGEFIKVAEKSGLIIPLGEWVLREACLQLRAWNQANPGLDDLTVSVNVSAKQIVRPEFTVKVREILAETGLEPSKLRLEITENAYIDNQSVLADLLTELRALGVVFIVDDFGTGFSSLGYLRNIPVNAIKIDKSFVDGILEDGKDFQIINTILMLAQGMGMDAIAEGIENPEQIKKLLALNCRYGQGFHLSRPVDAREVEKMLQGRRA
jgi:diguanylate cyclase (GGDEF)-like protein